MATKYTTQRDADNAAMLAQDAAKAAGQDDKRYNTPRISARTWYVEETTEKTTKNEQGVLVTVPVRVRYL